jgi:SAM-dependent methyltransferase
MTIDVVDLREFYASPLGEITQRLLAKVITHYWPKGQGMSFLGFGYPTPFMDELHNDAARALVFMPAEQGVIPWPEQGNNAAALINEDCLPLPDESIDRILIVHSLEHADPVRPYLRELWRVLKSDGRILVIVPNRRGVWARFDDTPFGHGNPYTINQLSKLLRDNQFTPLHSSHDLFVLPSQRAIFRSLSSACEWLGPRVLSKFSGVITVEASKQVYAAYPVRRKRPVPSPAIARLC